MGSDGRTPNDTKSSGWSRGSSIVAGTTSSELGRIVSGTDSYRIDAIRRNRITRDEGRAEIRREGSVCEASGDVSRGVGNGCQPCRARRGRLRLRISIVVRTELYQSRFDVERGSTRADGSSRFWIRRKFARRSEFYPTESCRVVKLAQALRHRRSLLFHFSNLLRSDAQFHYHRRRHSNSETTPPLLPSAISSPLRSHSSQQAAAASLPPNSIQHANPTSRRSRLHFPHHSFRQSDAVQGDQGYAPVCLRHDSIVDAPRSTRNPETSRTASNHHRSMDRNETSRRRSLPPSDRDFAHLSRSTVLDASSQSSRFESARFRHRCRRSSRRKSGQLRSRTPVTLSHSSDVLPGRSVRPSSVPSRQNLGRASFVLLLRCGNDGWDESERGNGSAESERSTGDLLPAATED